MYLNSCCECCVSLARNELSRSWDWLCGHRQRKWVWGSMKAWSEAQGVGWQSSVKSVEGLERGKFMWKVRDSFDKSLLYFRQTEALMERDTIGYHSFATICLTHSQETSELSCATALKNTGTGSFNRWRSGKKNIELHEKTMEKNCP